MQMSGLGEHWVVNPSTVYSGTYFWPPLPLCIGNQSIDLLMCSLSLLIICQCLSRFHETTPKSDQVVLLARITPSDNTAVSTASPATPAKTRSSFLGGHREISGADSVQLRRCLAPYVVWRENQKDFPGWRKEASRRALQNCTRALLAWCEAVAVCTYMLRAFAHCAGVRVLFWEQTLSANLGQNVESKAIWCSEILGIRARGHRRACVLPPFCEWIVYSETYSFRGIVERFILSLPHFAVVVKMVRSDSCVFSVQWKSTAEWIHGSSMSRIFYLRIDPRELFVYPLGGIAYDTKARWCCTLHQFNHSHGDRIGLLERVGTSISHSWFYVNEVHFPWKFKVILSPFETSKSVVSRPWTTLKFFFLVPVRGVLSTPTLRIPGKSWPSLAGGKGGVIKLDCAFEAMSFACCDAPRLAFTNLVCTWRSWNLTRHSEKYSVRCLGATVPSGFTG